MLLVTWLVSDKSWDPESLPPPSLLTSLGFHVALGRNESCPSLWSRDNQGSMLRIITWGGLWMRTLNQTKIFSQMLGCGFWNNSNSSDSYKQTWSQTAGDNSPSHLSRMHYLQGGKCILCISFSSQKRNGFSSIKATRQTEQFLPLGLPTPSGSPHAPTPTPHIPESSPPPPGEAVVQAWPPQGTCSRTTQRPSGQERKWRTIWPSLGNLQVRKAKLREGKWFANSHQKDRAKLSWA